LRCSFDFLDCFFRFRAPFFILLTLTFRFSIIVDCVQTTHPFLVLCFSFFVHIGIVFDKALGNFFTISQDAKVDSLVGFHGCKRISLVDSKDESIYKETIELLPDLVCASFFSIWPRSFLIPFSFPSFHFLSLQKAYSHTKEHAMKKLNVRSRFFSFCIFFPTAVS
jgi:hypothetical protein